MHLDIKNKAQYAIFVKACSELPKIATSTGTIDCCAEIIMDEMFTFVEATRTMKRLCKTKMVIITTECTDNEVLTIKGKYMPEAPHNHRDMLKKRFGKELVEIVNDRFI